jgi:hypothetical protein
VEWIHANRLAGGQGKVKKAPNTNIQAQRRSKIPSEVHIQERSAAEVLTDWNLKLGTSLELGA